MRFSPFSFLMGLAAASLVTTLSRVGRPLAVEVAAVGMGMFDDARRMVAEQAENFEDIVAEARARREHLAAAAMASADEPTELDDEPEGGPEPEQDQPATAERPRRRSNGVVRRRAS
jgi:hypothetical protein